MFDLNTEVDKWVKDAVGQSCFNRTTADEIKDHLYCEIERNIDEGLSEESAFWAATRRLGLSEDLKAEFGKNETQSCEAEPAWIRRFNRKQILLMNVAFLIFFAAITFGSTIYLNGTVYEGYITPILYMLMFVPVIMTIGVNKEEECAAIKKLIKKVF